MAQQVKDPALPHLWHRFDPGLGLPRAVSVAKKKKKKKSAIIAKLIIVN